MLPKNLYWHGSIYLIADDHLLPGSKIGREHFKMNRNNTVFVTSSARQAINMGAPQYHEDLEGRAPYKATCAPFLYLVEPKYLYDRESTRCHDHILEEERQCRRARIHRRFYCEDIFKPIAESRYRPIGDDLCAFYPFEALEESEPDVWLPTS